MLFAMRLVMVAMVLAVGCMAPKTSQRTTTAKGAKVINVTADATMGTAWVTFRNTTVERTYLITEAEMGGAPKKTELVDTTITERDIVWLCTKTEGADRPTCSRAYFGQLPTAPQPPPTSQPAPVTP